MESAVYEAKWFTWDQQDLASQASAIRQQVFVVEQQVDHAEEYDEFEQTSRHVLLTYNGISIGTARWRHTEKGVKLERFAVLKEYRGHGAGSVILNEILKEATVPHKTVYLHAQLPAMNLYRRAGFKEQGELFYEAGLAHYKMVLDLSVGY
ncbi:MAG: GNAT family N-acetyltransferase [Bacteroidota bacterium]